MNHDDFQTLLRADRAGGVEMVPPLPDHPARADAAAVRRARKQSRNDDLTRYRQMAKQAEEELLALRGRPAPLDPVKGAVIEDALNKILDLFDPHHTSEEGDYILSVLKSSLGRIGCRIFLRVEYQKSRGGCP